MMNATRRLLLGAFAMAVVTPILSAAVTARSHETVFVMTNDARNNQVIASVHEPDGTLIEQRRYDTGGRGTGGVNDPLEAQGSLTLSQDRSLLFAANAGSGEITVFRVVGDSLYLADKVPSGGSEPVAIAQRQNSLYVLNAGGAGSVVAFQIGFGGNLRQTGSSPVFLSANATGGSSIDVSPDGHTVAVVERIANIIDTFQVRPDGALSPAVVNNSPGAGAFAAQFAPDGALIVSETGPAAAVDGSAISSYRVLSNGTLAAISQSVPTDGAANCWNAISPDGTRVYVSNAGTSDIAGFTIGQSGALQPLPGVIVGSNPSGSTNLDIAISSDGRFLYSLNGELGTIGVFLIRTDGSLQEVRQIGGLPKAAGYNGIAAL